MDRGAWQVPWGRTELDTTERLTLHFANGRTGRNLKGGREKPGCFPAPPFQEVLPVNAVSLPRFQIPPDRP